MQNRIKVLVALLIGIEAIGLTAQTNVTTTGGTANTVPVFTGSSTVGNSPIKVTAGGNLGIGTTSPATTLDVDTNGAQGFGGIDVRGSDGHSATLYPSLGAGYYNYIVQAGDQAIIYTNGSVGTGGFVIAPHVNGGSPTGLRMDNNGNVGIGMTNPTTLLEVNGSTKVHGTLTVTGSGGVEVQSGGITFPDGTFQTSAYPASSSGGSAPIQVVNNEAVINTGISANGSGLKHVSSNASCQTIAYNDNYCTVTIPWPGAAFVDTNYDVVCNPKTGANASNSPNPQAITLYVPDTGKTTTAVTVTVQYLGTNAGGTITLAPGISCIAIHN